MGPLGFELLNCLGIAALRSHTDVPAAMLEIMSRHYVYISGSRALEFFNPRAMKPASG